MSEQPPPSRGAGQLPDRTQPSPGDAGPAAPKTGVLLVECGVRGAELRLDGEPTRLGKEHQLRVGKHMIEVHAPGHAAYRMEVEIAAGKPRLVSVKLRRIAPPRQCKDPRNPLCKP